MIIHLVEAELLHADRETRRRQQSLFAILRTRLKSVGPNTLPCGTPVERGTGIKTTSIHYSKRLILQVRPETFLTGSSWLRIGTGGGHL